MDEINFMQQWHHAWYRFYDGLARLFLRLENENLENEKFWTYADKFEKYHRKANASYEKYKREKDRNYERMMANSM